MKKEIEKKRADILQYFDDNGKIDDPIEVYYSQSGHYFIEIERFLQNDPERNWVVTKVAIRHKVNTAYYFEFLTDNDDAFFEWLLIGEKEYLLLAEFQGGQSVFDVSFQKLYSHFSEGDPFIWIEIYPSPNQIKLAVLGCYWACPSEIVVYDCENILELPFLSIYRHLSIDFEFNIWLDNNTFVLTDKVKNHNKTINLKQK